MNLCDYRNSRFLVIFLGLFVFSIPAFSQRATLGADIGQVTDKYGSLPSTSALEGIIDGQVTILTGSGKQGEPSIVGGGEIRIPENSNEHPREFAAFGGPEFHFGNFVLGLHLQIRKIYQPSSQVGSLFFIRNNMLLLELPVVAQYNFGASHRAFIRAEGISEFNPHYRNSANGTETFANPQLDHGYSLRGSAGYDFSHWYLKATYETRYFKFSRNFGNPDGLDNWRSDLVTGGVGLVW